MDELNTQLILARCPGLHSGHLRALQAQLTSMSDLLQLDEQLLRDADWNAAAIHALKHPDAAVLDSDLAWVSLPGHAYIGYDSQHYPPLLQQLYDAPLGLFVSGDASCLAQPQIAMVGARNPTSGGRANAHAFAAQLAERGLTITSGLAAGIDSASHDGALAGGGMTIAVCGTGPDVIYPHASRELAQRIEQHGALVTEFPPNTPPLKQNFPRRNRIISGLALGTLVIEAALRSGSLITARLAAEQGREVFAIPGSIHNVLARGCHQLIRSGAKLVESCEDILSELAPLASAFIHTTATPSARSCADPDLVLDKDYKMLLDALGFDAVRADELISRTGLRADEVASMLLILELEDRIESLPGGLYVRAHPEATK